MQLKQPAIFLDRDGVLNQLIARDGGFYSPRTFADFQLNDGVREACHQLHTADFQLFVVTNQPDINRRLMDPAELQKMHDYLRSELPITQIYVCPHAGVKGEFNDPCTCRKPLPGLLLEAAAAHDIALDQSFMIGDMPTDIEAGKAAGCQTILLPTEKTDLLTAANWILSLNPTNKIA